MGATELLAMATSFGLLAGWRLYAAVLAAGLGMRLGLVPLPEALSALAVLASPWVLGAAALSATVELVADKIAWIDSLWDTVHAIIRPLGGALLALAIIDPAATHWQVAIFLLGGGSALLSHTAKASARAAINMSPEPASNVAVSVAEDVTAFGALAIALSNPALALVIVALMLAAAVGIVLAMRRFVADMRAVWRWRRPRGPGQ